MPWKPISLYNQIDQLRRSLRTTSIPVKETRRYQTHLVINVQLILQDLVPDFVDLIGLVAVVLLASINGSPFAIPNAKTPLVHPFPLLLVAPAQSPQLLSITSISLWCRREAKERIVVDGVRGVLPFLVRIAKVTEIRCKGVSVKENGMVGINGANGVVNAVVKRDDAGVLGVRRFVDWVIPSDPLVAFVVSCKLLPQPDGAILKVLVSPDWTQNQCQARYSG